MNQLKQTTMKNPRKLLRNWLENLEPERQRDIVNMIIQTSSVCIIIGLVIFLKHFNA